MPENLNKEDIRYLWWKRDRRTWASSPRIRLENLVGDSVLPGLDKRLILAGGVYFFPFAGVDDETSFSSGA